MLFSFYPICILLAPLLSGIIIGLFGRVLGPRLGRVGVAFDVIAFALSLFLLYETTVRGPQSFQLTQASDGFFQIGFYLDRLAAVMLVHIAGISILIHLFSIRYMQQERGYGRFHSLLAFTTFVLFGMVTSANLLILLIFWQLISWLVPLLSHNYTHAPTVRGAFRTFIMQRLGDVAFLAAAVVAYSFYGTLDLQQLAGRAAAMPSFVTLWPGGFSIQGGTLITLLLFIAAMSKSAQFPLHMWLPDSLYAPTPVHALLHAGIINAGGFLLARLAPLFALSPATLHWVFAIGTITALLGSSMMLVQNDIKKTLGYSTIGQMGFMIMECGLGAYGLAIFHLIAHGLFKGSIFLNCGYVIHAARQEPRLPPLKDAAAQPAGFSSLAWFTGFITTLILPLIILLAVHGILRIPLGQSHGATIFLFFGWATSSQAILTMYRLRAVASWKVAVSMLCSLFLVVVTYLMAAESFSYFLYSAPGEVDYYFKAAALPGWLFDSLVSGFALIIVIGWFLIYARSHGRTIRLPNWVRRLQVRIYLLLLNRLYLDALAMRLRRLFTQGIERLDGSKLFKYGGTLLAAALALFIAVRQPAISLAQVVLFLSAAFLLPLFPFQGIYVAALTHRNGYLADIAAVLLPAAGLYALANLSRDMPPEALHAVGVLALCGAIYSSVKALAQVKIPHLLAHAGSVFFSAFWWRFAATGALTGDALVYVSSAVLLIAGLLLAWQRAQARLGILTLDRMHGLARPMPRFATLLALLVMAATGLYPFGLLSSYLAMLTQPATAISWGLGVMTLSWFFVSWYLFRMMQRLLFGAQRGDIVYRDLRANEIIAMAAVLAIVTLLGLMPRQWLTLPLLTDVRQAFAEVRAWPK